MTPDALTPKTPRLAIEHYFRTQFPGAFRFRSESVFDYKGSKPFRPSSDALMGRILGPQGSTTTPTVYIPELSGFARYSPVTGIYQLGPAETAKAAYYTLIDDLCEWLESAGHSVATAASMQREDYAERVVRALKSQARMPLRAFAYDGTHLHVQNGVLDLETMELKSFSLEYPSLHRVDVRLDGTPRRPAAFLRMIARMVPAREDRELLLDAFAAALLGNQGQSILALLGGGGTGKSTLVDILCRLVGEGRAEPLRLVHARGRFEASAWEGKLVLHADEASSGALEDVPDELKRLSGQDEISVEQKFSNERRKFRSQALPVLCANGSLRIPVRCDYQAWARRILPVMVDGPPPDRVRPGYADELWRAEGADILWHVASRAARIRKRPFGQTLSERQRRAQSKIIGPDRITSFVREQVQPRHHGQLLMQEVVDALGPELRAEGAHPGDKTLRTRLWTLMQEVHGAKRSQSLARGRGWRGFGLRGAGLGDDP